jgi:alkanesulfonate monooxygenase SsuD/methylene tetrahydromethanopterin reductase-like flavin-dependent oxidoreductase (luciferase family)/FAD/FMN-containing dehydrogenase
MPDYGHPLRFGTFIQPSSQQPDLTVALAQLSEQLGYDLVTFQDHPYLPAYLDTWTLMSWIAARTERIHVASNVLNLPLRPPAVIARAAASLDLLSGGRFDLGLGAGGFWDAIEAMGGGRRSAGQSIDALDEAIDVIRGIWDADERAPLRTDGPYYPIRGAKRGPAPAHDIPIWLGAYKPRILRLAGRKADGWLPSLPYLKPGDLQAGNQVIDEAAQAAGRDPAEIRRLLNISGSFATTSRGLLDGPAEKWVSDLLPLVLEDGVSTLIVMADDPDMMRQFAEQVMPPLREAVDRERTSRGRAAAPGRSIAALARRRDGIDYDGLPASLAQAAVEPGDFDYSRVRSTYLRGGAPGLVLRVTSVPQVLDALAFARDQEGIAMSVRSGGHGVSGRSTNDGGIIIDLSALNTIEILDKATRRIRLGPGARWMDVAAELAPHGWALSSGDYGGVGVGGLATAGGIGWLAREHGLTIDHLRSAQIVLADGTVAAASPDENPDLFWGIRGAGANFGIVTSFEFEADEVGDIGFAQLAFDASDTAGFFQRWGAAVEAAPRDVSSEVILGAPRRGQPSVAQVMVAVDSDDADTVLARLQPLAQIAPLVGSDARITSYAAVMANASPGPHQGQGEPVTRSGLIRHITPEFAAAIEKLMATGLVYFFQIRSLGGAVADVPADATAFGTRDANFSVVAFGADRARLDEAWEDLYQHFRGLYLSFETDTRPERLSDAFPAATLERLRELKRRYDPDNVFRDNFNIAPYPASATSA